MEDKEIMIVDTLERLCKAQIEIIKLLKEKMELEREIVKLIENQPKNPWIPPYYPTYPTYPEITPFKPYNPWDNITWTTTGANFKLKDGEITIDPNDNIEDIMNNFVSERSKSGK